MNNESQPFKSLNISGLIISDTRTVSSDKSGKILEDRIKESRHILISKLFVKDEPTLIKEEISKILKKNSDLCRIFANHFSSGAKIFALIFAREQRCGQRSVFELGEGQRWAFPVWGIYALYTPKPDAPFLPLAE